jgi:hypothetical protein
MNRKVLESGSSLAIIVGGSEEMMQSQPHTDILVLKKRKGFIRLALQNGADLVPVYGYGVTDLYYQVHLSCHSIVHHLQMTSFKAARMWLLKKTRIAFTFGVGTWCCYLLPVSE